MACMICWPMSCTAPGELDKTNTLFLSHSPGAVQDIGQQIMQAMIAAEKAGKG